MTVPCPICLEERKAIPLSGDSIHVNCARCGDFKISRTAITCIKNNTPSERQRAIASSIIREGWQNMRITSEDLEALFSAKDIPILEKADRLLQAYESGSSHVGARIPHSVSSKMIADCWAKDADEVLGLRALLCELCRTGEDAKGIYIAAEGWRRLDELRVPNQSSGQGFVAMWFDSSMDRIYEDCLAPAISLAGYSPLRVDQYEHAGKIDDEIIRQIRRSRFLVADATGHRGGVYYEAGFAYGLGLKVFWTCRNDYFKDLHFDIRQYNCIMWFPDKLDDFKTTLAKRIEAELGQGPFAR